MLLAAWLLVSGIAAAYSLLRRFAPALTPLESLALGIPVGLAAEAWSGFIVSLAAASLAPLPLIACSLFFTAAAIAFSPPVRADADVIRTELGRHRLLAAIIVAGMLFFGFLFSTHILETRPDGWYSGGSTWGDLSAHLTLMHSFLTGANAHLSFPPAFPLLANTPLTYPFLPDFHAAMLAAGGASTRDALLVPSLILSLSLLILLYSFAFRFTRSETVAGVTVILIVFMGGLGFLSLPNDLLASNIPAADFLSHLPSDYIRGVGSAGQTLWFNFVSDMLLPQRGAQFAWPLAVGIMLLAWTGWNDHSPTARRNAFALAGILAGLLPLLQAHALIALGIAFLVPAAIDFLSNAGKRWDWLYFYLPAGLLALPQLLFFSARAASGGFLHFQPFWQGFSGGPIVFWLVTLGLFIILAIAGFAFLSPRQRIFYSGFLAVFILANFISFQPWTVDNTKLFAYWITLAACVAALCLDRVISRAPQFVRPAAWAVLLLALTASGILSLAHESESHYLFLSNEDIAFGNWVAAHTPADAVFLTSDWHAHPVVTIAGRQIVMGYRGRLWSYGLQYSRQESDVREMFAGGQDAQNLLSFYHVRFIAVDSSQQSDFPANKAFLSRFPIVYSSSSLTLYSVPGG